MVNLAHQSVRVIRSMSSFGWKAVTLRRRRRRSSRPSLTYKDCVIAYFQETILHGYRYVMETGRSLSERGLWFAILLVMIGSMSYIVTDYYLRFINAPTATSQQAIRVPISEIPFPAVVLCPSTRLNKSAVRGLADEM